MTAHPIYTYPPGELLRLGYSFLAGGKRSLRKDGQACIDRLRPPLHIIGKKNIPREGPCLITFNHYFRPGFRAWWLALGIAAVVPRDMHWIMTGEWTFPGHWYSALGAVLSRKVASRLANMYGFTAMPPMPPREQDIALRAAAVRRVLSIVKETKEPMLGFSPEGMDTSDGRLGLPPSGVGRFILLLAGMGMRIVPVGAYEEEEVFTLNFGKIYNLVQPGGMTPDERDLWAAKTIMQKIAVLLPPPLRGEFST